ncbi:LysR family transcriptional regulator [Tatumella sp. JGM118]|uniref:LysR family transcriptional regulator n=1 Tax=Tatumella sp. JGM118 TaxID=2799796 RepID=UPI001BB04137|nr:LysR family transcriptional regulator [Tatumella sp. JGM118]MBS0910547.1 LysR family transcriptional regulator [Tatumella sp. JGM118]
MKQIPPLNSLKVFFWTSQCSSFSQAASDNHLTKGAISLQIKQLEDWLGVKLFIRSRDGVELTRHGVELKKTCEIVFSLLEDQVQTLKKNTKAVTKINIGCSGSLLRHLFLQNQKRISAEFPEYQLVYNTTTTIDSLFNNTTDVYLSRGIPALTEGLKEVMLFRDEIGLVASRNYLERHAQGITVCHALSRESAWDEWCRTSCQMQMLPVVDELRFESLSLALDAARFGLGVVVAPWFLAEPEIRQGNLFAPFGFVECGTGTRLYHRDDVSDAILQFIDKFQSTVTGLKKAPHNDLNVLR